MLGKYFRRKKRKDKEQKSNVYTAEPKAFNKTKEHEVEAPSL